MPGNFAVAAWRLEATVRRKKRKSWRARYYELQAELRSVRERLAQYQMVEKMERLRQQMNWSDYDVAQSRVTRAEQELFEASPAYRKYQELRADRERRGAGDWRLKRGDWRTP